MQPIIVMRKHAKLFSLFIAFSFILLLLSCTRSDGEKNMVALDSYCQGSAWTLKEPVGVVSEAYKYGKECFDVVTVEDGNRSDFLRLYQIERYGIKSSPLPEGDVLANERIPFYAVHKGLVWGVVFGVAVLGGIIAALFLNFFKRRKAEEAVRRSEEKYRTLVNNVNIGVYRNTIGQGRFIQANPAMAKIFGYDSLEEFMGINAVDLYQDPADRQSFIDEVRRNRAVKDKVLALKKRDGTQIWCSVSVTAQFDDKKEIRWMDGVIEDITVRKNVEDALRRAKEELELRVRERTADLSAANEELRKLAAHLQSVREDERIKVAREIHDELGQALMALKMDVTWLCSKFGDQEIIAQKRMSILNLLDDTIKSVKRICTELRPGILDNIGIVAAIEWQAAEFQKRTGISCEVTFGNDEMVLDAECSTAVFRIFQEALTNVVRHAEATKISAHLEEDEGCIRLSVTDNGKGISEEDILKTHSFGLLGMRERVHSFGGEVKISGRPLHGTMVSVIIPREKIKK